MFKHLFAVIAIIAIVSFLALTQSAQAQVYPYNLIAPTNLPTVVAAGATSNSLSSDIVLNPGKGLALSAKFVTGAGTSNIVVQLTPTVDGTNYETTNWQWTFAANGGTAVLRTTNWSAATLAGYTKLRITGITNQNASIITNQGVYANRVDY